MIGYWNGWSLGCGGLPTCPAATCAFCWFSALITSSGTSPKLCIFCGSSQIRML